MRTVIDRRHPRAMQVTALLVELVRRNVPSMTHQEERSLSREILEQCWADGVQMITEGDRIAAGLPPRNIHGLTVDELHAIENQLLLAEMKPADPIRWMGVDWGTEDGRKS